MLKVPRIHEYEEKINNVMKDGLWQLTYKGICAGFVVSTGFIIARAPILLRWSHDGLECQAKWICEDPLKRR